MATYVYNGKAVDLSDNLSFEEAYLKLQDTSRSPGDSGSSTSSSTGGSTPSSFSPDPIDKDLSLAPQRLAENKDWVTASRILYRATQGDDFKGSDEQAALWGLDRMARFNYNLPLQGVDAMRIAGFQNVEKKAFLHLLDTFDQNVEYSFGGLARAIKYMALDVTNYAGLATFGIGTAGGTATKLLTKEAVKQALRIGTLASIEGTIYGAATSYLDETARVNAGGKQEVDYGRIGIGAGVGAVGGLVLGTGANMLGTAFRKAPTDGIPAGGVRGTQTPEIAASEAPSLPAGPPTTSLRQVELGLDNPNDMSLTPEQRKALFEQRGKEYDAQRRMDQYVAEGRLDQNAEIDSAAGIASQREIYEAAREPRLPMDMPQDINAVPPRGEYKRDYREQAVRDLYGTDDPKIQDELFGITLPQDEFGSVRAVGRDVKGRLLVDDQNFIRTEASKGETKTLEGDFRYPRLQPTEEQGSLFYVPQDQFGSVRAIGRDAEGRLLTDAADNVLIDSKVGSGIRFTDGTAPGEMPPKPTSPAKRAGGKGAKEKTPVDVSPSTQGIVNDAVNGGATIKELISTVQRVADELPGLVSKTADIRRVSQEASAIIRKLGVDGSEKVEDVMRKLGMSDAERQVLNHSVVRAENEIGRALFNVIEARDSAKDKFIFKSLDDQAKSLQSVYDPIHSYARLIAGQQGADLGSRARLDILNKGDLLDVTPSKLLQKKGIDDPTLATERQRQAAEREFVRLVRRHDTIKMEDVDVNNLRLQGNTAANEGMLDEATKLWAKADQLAAEKLAREKAETVGDGLFAKLGTGLNGVIRFLNEYVIATVLGPSSTLVNGITGFAQLLYKPLMNYIVKGPFSNAAAREMLTTYGAMWHMKSQAFQAAKKAFKLETTLMAADGSRWLEGQSPAIPGAAGGALRVWLRILTASDEFMQQMAYRGFLEGNTTYQALRKAAEDGMSKTEAKTFVRERVENAIKNGYTATKPDADVIAMLYRKAVDRGYKGDQVTEFIRRELDKPEVFQKATNQTGKNYVDDLLFKREFSQSPKSTILGVPVSQLAAGYENFVQKNPIVRLMGQLFFRTPVRVFEEGIRMTPGIQLISPNFIADLMGKNGDIRRVRAMGESLAAYGISISVMTAFAAGHITGGGPSNWKERRSRENVKDWEPYSIRVGDRFISFRNLDPFATPIKIMVNALERLENLEYRRSQGEFIHNSVYKEAVGYVSVAITSTAQAIRDANLAEGIDQLASFADAIADPENNQNTIQRFFGEKAALLVPNIVAKGVKSFGEGENVMNDPLTAEQFIRAKVNPADPLVTKQFDAIGFERTLNATGVLAFLGINTSTQAEREAGVPKKVLEVREALNAITIATGKTFIRNHKSELFPDIDLRTEMTADGKTTLYNRAMEIYRESGVVDALHTRLISFSQNSKGSRPQDGVDTDAAERLMDTFWKQTLLKLKYENENLLKRSDAKQQFKLETILGQREVDKLPYR